MDVFEKTTFWSIISNDRIEIPIIQRDYAQGRQTVKITQIREKFVNDIIISLDATNPKSKPLHLDFVYGRIYGKDLSYIQERNKDAISKVLAAVQTYANQLELKINYDLIGSNNISDLTTATKLIPLDGQQRLTTLFLLHWYILTRIETKVKREKERQILDRFSYNTRNSSRDFCRYLNNIVPDYSESEKKLSELIVDHKIFFNEWQKDPTVKGMLVMLDYIHSRIKGNSLEQLQNYWDMLTIKKRITFHFLDLEELSQTDELYVKMNARGKQLTDFEHFKASLYEYNTEATSTLITDKWKRSLDKEWTDIFWKEGDPGTVDDRLYNFIRSVNLYHYIESTEKRAIDRYLLDRIRISDSERNYIPFEDYKKRHFFTSDSLTFVQECLDALSGYAPGNFDIHLRHIFCSPFADFSQKLEHTFIANKQQWPDLWLRTYYYAFLLFIKDKPNLAKPEPAKQFNEWMRICRNLIYNTYIQNPDNFIDAIKAIASLKNSRQSIANDIENDKVVIPFFAGQAKEEKKKLLYLKDNNWSSTILGYENHPYFYGQIGFMFDLIDDDPKRLSQFKHYGAKLSQWFGSELHEKNRLRFQRALLCKGDYLVAGRSKWSFCVPNANLRSLNENWRSVFNDPKKLHFLKDLLNDKRDFKAIIDSYNEKGWKGYFIKWPSTIKYAEQRIIDCDDVLDIKLLQGTTYNGKNTSFYLYLLYLKIKNIAQASATFEVKHEDINNYPTKDTYPILKINYKGSSTVILTISYRNKKFDFVAGKTLPATSYFKSAGSFSIYNEKDMRRALNKICKEIRVL